jgi:hypothetical protein
MKAHALLTKAAAGLGTVALVLTLSACSTHKLATGQDTGEIRTEQAAQQQANSGNTIGTAPAPANAQGVETKSAPAVISGPAKVDNSGNLYSSSSVGSSGNASATGLNTNVNVLPKKGSSTVTVTETPAPVETTSVTTVETTPPPAPAPAPVVETPAPAPEPAPPMISSTTETTTTTTRHRRMRKD